MKHVLVIGGGPAGMEASVRLSELGFAVTLVEQSNTLGGKLSRWNRLFPDNQPAGTLLQKLTTRLGCPVQRLMETRVVSVQKDYGQFTVHLHDTREVKADAILVATGFDVFDARKKEEYGYGIYENVMTSSDLERLWRDGRMLQTAAGNSPKRIGMIHCVGSRDEKAGNAYCSKVCCITAVKQSIELKEKHPDCEVFCFYMDLRMYGKGFEAMYRKAQIEHGVQFIRGRLSESSENPDGSLMLKVEDTLLGKPMRMSVDTIVLMVGMTPSVTTGKLIQMLRLETDTDRFIKVADANDRMVQTTVPGVFVAGTCTGPKSVYDTINEARAAALHIHRYFQEGGTEQ